jgi:hypothetical protein
VIVAASGVRTISHWVATAGNHGLGLRGGLLVATGPARLPVAQAAGQPPLLPAAGQFVSVTPAYVLNTLTGLGESSAQPLAAGATIKFSVTGSAGVPSGAQSVAVDISPTSPLPVGS